MLTRQDLAHLSIIVKHKLIILMTAVTWICISTTAWLLPFLFVCLLFVCVCLCEFVCLFVSFFLMGHYKSITSTFQTEATSVRPTEKQNYYLCVILNSVLHLVNVFVFV